MSRVRSERHLVQNVQDLLREELALAPTRLRRKLQGGRRENSGTQNDTSVKYQNTHHTLVTNGWSSVGAEPTG